MKRLKSIWQEQLLGIEHKYVTFLTGAGISAESGIPTYRGKDGFWTIGSENYKATEIGTFRFFQRNPKEVWNFTLYKRSFLKAEPNPGHVAIVEFKKILGNKMKLITQNVDRLHVKSGYDPDEICEIHGHLEGVRCSSAICSEKVLPFPSEIGFKDRGDRISAKEEEQLKCPLCGEWLRPNILWFDEFYNEKYYKSETAMNIVSQTDLLIVVGTTLKTNLPQQIVENVLLNGGTVININPDPNPFAETVDLALNGYWIESTASEALQEMLAQLKRAI